MKYYKRGFLNKGEGTAAFEADLSGDQYETDGDKYFSAYFCISDCSRKITLDFGGNTEEMMSNSLHKIDTLISELSHFRDKLIEVHAWVGDKESE